MLTDQVQSSAMRYVTSVIEAVWGVTLPVEHLGALFVKGGLADLIALFARTRF